MLDSGRWIGGMLGALEDEIRHRHRPEGAERLDVGEGHRIDRPAKTAGYLYEFRGLRPVRVPGLLGGDLHIPGRLSVAVTVQSWPAPSTLRVISPEDLGEQVPQCVLHYHDDRVLRALSERLQGARDAAIDQIWLLFDREVSGLRQIQDPVVASPDVLGHLNRTQREAVAVALRSPLSRIWGPPGTGKTHTAAALAAEWIRAGRSVLLSGPTNRSTDHLLLTVLEALEWDRDTVDGRIVRLGDIESECLSVRWGEVVAATEVAARRRKAAEADLESVSADLTRLRRILGHSREGSERSEALTGEIEAALRWLAELRERAGVTPSAIVDRAQVVATTAHRIAVGQVRVMDALVMDEASMVPLPVGLLAALSARQITLVGDPRQLGPIVQSRSRRARLWLGTSIFEVEDQDGVAPVVQGPTTRLTEQHRMPPAVCTLVSELSYEGALQTAEARLQQDQKVRGAGVRPLTYLNTAGRLPATRPVPGPRYANAGQASLVVDAVRMVMGGCAGLRGDAAIITPYRAHARTLWNAARRAGVGSHLHIGTVHRMQGHEFAFVVLSFPEAPGDRPSPFLQATTSSDEGGRLLTVAASRALHNLLVVGHLSWLARTAPAAGPFLRFLRLLEEFGEPLRTHHEMQLPNEDATADPRGASGDLGEKGPMQVKRRSGLRSPGSRGINYE